MADSEAVKRAIQAVISQMMDRLLERVLSVDSFDEVKFKAEKPLYAALVPDEIFKGSHFERRFVTPFGHVWEQLAIVAANTVTGYGVTNRPISGFVKSERLARIAEILNELEHQGSREERRRPEWSRELEYILTAAGDENLVTVICDVYVEDRQRNQKYAFELKSPLPNSDITKVSKEKILKLYSMHPKQVDEAYFALPYNPYGQRKDYNWSFPSRWFDMKHDPVVLIGEEFWDKIGGVGTYRAFVEAVNEIGIHYKERIYREYLGTEPPDDIYKDIL